MRGQNPPSFHDALLKRDSLPIFCLSQRSPPQPASARVSYYLPTALIPATSPCPAQDLNFLPDQPPS